MTPDSISMVELILYICVLVGTISALFWRTIGNIRIQIAELKGILSGYDTNNKDMQRNHREMKDSIDHIDRQLTKLVGVLQGSGQINGSKQNPPNQSFR